MRRPIRDRDVDELVGRAANAWKRPRHEIELTRAYLQSEPAGDWAMRTGLSRASLGGSWANLPARFLWDQLGRTLTKSGSTGRQPTRLLLVAGFFLDGDAA